MLQSMVNVAKLEAELNSKGTKAARHLIPGAGQQAAAAAVKAAADARAADLQGYFQQLQAGGVVSLRALARRLNADGIPTPRGGQWTATAVKRVLERASVA
jgi:hypothetical protein